MKFTDEIIIDYLDGMLNDLIKNFLRKSLKQMYPYKKK